jgi:chorismate--pyruvate lyase
MSAQQPQTDNSILWHSEPELTGIQPDAILRGWLEETGLLTARLRQLCDSGFRLEVLAANANHATDNGIHRTVMLHCGDIPCVYAETTIPAVTAASHPWLNELGDEPLGERLQSQPDVQRSGFRFALMSAADLPVNIADKNAPLWARQSDFQLGETSLTVTEVFLPGIADSSAANVQAAD